MIGWTMALMAATFTCPLERVTTLDPIMVQSAYDSRVAKLIYESVLSIDYEARPYRLTAGACELPEVSEDGLVYRFRMRSRELTANDVVNEIERIRDPANASSCAYMMAKVKSVRAIDDRNLEIVLKEPQYVFPWMLTYAGIAKGDGTGTGPYRLEHWRKNHEMVFKRRKAEPTDGFDTIRYLVVDDASTQWLMFLKGEIDMLDTIARDNWDSVVDKGGKLQPELSRQGIRLYSTQTLDVMYLGINMRDPVLGKNRKLRQALNCAFDFPAWQRFYNDRVEPCNGPVPIGVKDRLEKPFPYAFDLEKAKQLLSDAGYPNGVDPNTGRRLTLSLSIGRPNQESREAGELMASFYAKVGIRLELDFKTWDAFLKQLNEGRVQLFRIGWVGDYPDAENFMQLFHSRNVSPGVNHSNYVNPQFDREYDLAMTAKSESERRAHWLKCQEIVCEDCPWVFQHYPRSYMILRNRVGNFIPSAFMYGNEQYFRVRSEE